MLTVSLICGRVNFFSYYRILISRIRCNSRQSFKKYVHAVQSHLKFKVVSNDDSLGQCSMNALRTYVMYHKVTQDSWGEKELIKECVYM